jgi:hypothetical protein
VLGRSKLAIVGLLVIGALDLAFPATRSGLALMTVPTENQGNVFSTAASFCSSGSTGFLDPSANAADSGGNNDGFELNPANVYSDGSGYASSINSHNDLHRYYNFGIGVSNSCAVKGIEVRLDWWLDAAKDNTAMSVELSWDGGTSWTAAKTDSQETTSEHTAVLGGSTDTWGRTWTVDELSNANFRVRVSTYGCCTSTWTYRDFYLDWVPVDVYYGP